MFSSLNSVRRNSRNAFLPAGVTIRLSKDWAQAQTSSRVGVGLSSDPKEQKEGVTAGESSFCHKVTTYCYKTHKPLALPERESTALIFLSLWLKHLQAGFVFIGVCCSFIFFFFFGLSRLGFSA